MTINAKKRLQVYTRDQFCCVECGGNKHLTVDHIIPLSRGGTDELTNLQTFCKPCNLKKGNYYIHWWRKLFPFMTVREGNHLRNDLLGALASRDGLVDNKIKNQLKDKGIETVSKVQTLLDNFKRAEGVPTALEVTGIKNSVEAYAKRSQERDDKLLKIIKLLTSEVETLHARISGIDNRPATDREFDEF